LIPAETDIQMIEGAGHDLKKGAFDLEERVLAAFTRLIRPR
jgi:hypothetical protein